MHNNPQKFINYDLTYKIIRFNILHVIQIL